MDDYFLKHRWSWCEMCGPMVICGKCGNNSCNGGYGTVGDEVCDACKSAYDLQENGIVPQEFAEKLAILEAERNPEIGGGNSVPKQL